MTKIVSFDVFNPTEFYDFGFTETGPYHGNFEWLGYETSNFYECIGSVLLFGLILLLKQFLQVILFKIF